MARMGPEVSRLVGELMFVAKPDPEQRQEWMAQVAAGKAVDQWPAEMVEHVDKVSPEAQAAFVALANAQADQAE